MCMLLVKSWAKATVLACTQTHIVPGSMNRTMVLLE